MPNKSGDLKSLSSVGFLPTKATSEAFEEEEEKEGNVELDILASSSDLLSSSGLHTTSPAVLNDDVLRLVLETFFPSLDAPPQPNFLRSEVYPLLVSCCLVSKSFNRVSTPILYQHLDLGRVDTSTSTTSDSVNRYLRSRRRLRSLVQAVQSNPSLSSLIRSVHHIIERTSPQSPPLYQDTITTISLPRLEHLRLELRFQNLSFPSAWSHAPNLKTLILVVALSDILFAPGLDKVFLLPDSLETLVIKLLPSSAATKPANSWSNDSPRASFLPLPQLIPNHLPNLASLSIFNATTEHLNHDIDLLLERNRGPKLRSLVLRLKPFAEPNSIPTHRLQTLAFSLPSLETYGTTLSIVPLLEGRLLPMELVTTICFPAGFLLLENLKEVVSVARRKDVRRVLPSLRTVRVARDSRVGSEVWAKAKEDVEGVFDLEMVEPSELEGMGRIEELPKSLEVAGRQLNGGWGIYQ